MLLRLDGLMESVRITASRHDTSGNSSTIMTSPSGVNHIILIAEHQIVRPESQNDVVLYLQVLRIRKVFNMEETSPPFSHRLP